MPNSPHFVMVYDILADGWHDFPGLPMGLICLSISGTLFTFVQRRRRAKEGLDVDPRYRKVGEALYTFIVLFFVFGVIFIWASISSWVKYIHHRDLVQRNACALAEGAIHDFKSHHVDRKGDVYSFTVSGIPFSSGAPFIIHSLYPITPDSTSIGESPYVRLCYDPQDHEILRAEVRRDN